LREVLLLLKCGVTLLRFRNELKKELKYSDDQPRWSAGDPRGGQWRPKEGGEGDETSSDGSFGVAPDGTLIEAIAECTGISAHAFRRMQERGITLEAITDTLTNPLRIILQPNGNTLYIGSRARVVLSPKGWMVTCM
jgi:hypothetical protein